MQFARRHQPLLLSLAFLWTILAVLAAIVCHQTGDLYYALDDGYIQLAIGKHLAQNGVWGISPFAFSSTSSSPLWVVMFAGLNVIRLTSPYVPFVVNVLAGSLTLVFVAAILRSRGISNRVITLSLLATALLPPMGPVIFTGMEHSLHILFSVIFIYLASAALADDPAGYAPARRRRDWQLLLFAPLLTGIRFEGMFPLAFICFFFLLRRRWLFAPSSV